MVLFNYATRELTAKIVYYGAGLCGKTTNLEFVHKSLPEKTRGKMLSLATQTDRTLFFDFLPLDLGSLKGMKTRMQLYTVPGQVFYDATRKLVLKGADGIVFVVDSQKELLQSNLDSWENLKQNLLENNLSIHTIPVVMQFNKRDLPNKMSIKELNSKINEIKAPYYEAVAITGKGVEETLKGVSKLVLQSLSQRFLREPQVEKEEEPIQRQSAEEEMLQEVPKSSKLVVVKSSLKEEAPAELKSDDEEVKELPRGVVEAEADVSLITLEPLVESQEEPATFDELEEVEDITEVVHRNPQVSAANPMESLDRFVSKASVLERLDRPTHAPPKFASTHSGIATVSKQNDEMPLTNLASSEDINIPVEISVGKGEDEVKLRISINLKIRLLRD